MMTNPTTTIPPTLTIYDLLGCIDGVTQTVMSPHCHGWHISTNDQLKYPTAPRITANDTTGHIEAWYCQDDSWDTAFVLDIALPSQDWIAVADGEGDHINIMVYRKATRQALTLTQQPIRPWYNQTPKQILCASSLANTIPLGEQHERAQEKKH
jgi:hypothetical protein